MSFSRVSRNLWNTKCNLQLDEYIENDIYSLYLYYFHVILNLYECVSKLGECIKIKLNSQMLVTMMLRRKQRTSTITTPFCILMLNVTCIFLFDHCRLEMYSHTRSNCGNCRNFG